jgi:hypothetical protein
MLAGPFGRYQAAEVHAAGLVMLAGGELVMTSLAVLLAIALVPRAAPGPGPEYRR